MGEGTMTSVQEHKKSAAEFLQWVTDGKIDEAFQKHVLMAGKHHNAFTPKGFAALKKGMSDNDRMFPNKKFNILRVVGEGDLVVVHSHLELVPGEKELAVVHLMRFEGGKIAEFWDLPQMVPSEVVNEDGLF
jgi:predicted SnoaL-like aldol condensation-catalyzing enzyme